MSPGSYLAAGRAAAGLTHLELVDQLARTGSTHDPLLLVVLLPAIEADQIRADDADLAALSLLFPICPGTYRRLCAEADALAALTPNESLQNGTR